MAAARLIFLALALASSAHARPSKKAKPPPPPAPAKAEPELKRAPDLPPAAEPGSLAPVASPAPIERPAQRAPIVVGAPAESVAVAAFPLRLVFGGGLTVPVTSTLRPGWVASLGAQFAVGSFPLEPFVRLGFERHTALSSIVVAPPAGGFEGAALEAQTLMPITLGAQVRVLADAHNELTVGGLGRVLVVGSKVSALGSSSVESGVGAEIGAEAGYARRFGSIWLFVQVSYSLRRTAVGRVSAALELPWYQVIGAGAGLAL